MSSFLATTRSVSRVLFPSTVSRNSDFYQNQPGAVLGSCELTARRCKVRSPSMLLLDCKTKPTTREKSTGSMRLQRLSPSCSKVPAICVIRAVSTSVSSFRNSAKKPLSFLAMASALVSVSAGRQDESSPTYLISSPFALGIALQSLSIAAWKGCG